MDDDGFVKAAEAAKENCPVSQALGRGRDQPGRGAGELAPPPTARLIAHSAIPIKIIPPA